MIPKAYITVWRNPMKRFFLFLLLLAPSQTLLASDWYKIEGRYATVEFNSENRAIADSLLKIAELDIPRLCKMAGLPLQSYKNRKARIILSQAPDMSNGYAIGKAVVIYALSSMYLPLWTGNDSWYKMVLSHELVHQTVFRKTRRKLSFTGFLSGFSIPRWFHEGVAQYFAERWTAFRGDIYLKEALLSGRLTYDNMNNLNDGRLLYAAGHAFVRYLAATYGDSSLLKLLSYQQKGWYYDFDKAFKAVYQKQPKDLFPDFIRQMVVFYGNELAAYPLTRYFKPLPESGYTVYQMLPVKLSDSVFVAVLKQNAVHLYNSAVILQYKKGQTHILQTITNHLNTPLVLSPDKQWLAFGQYDLKMQNDQAGFAYRWFVYNLNRKRRQLIARNVRARYAVFDRHNHLLLAEVTAQGTRIVKYLRSTKQPEDVFQTSMPVGFLSCTANGALLFDAQRANGRRDLFLLKNGRLSGLTNDAVDNRHPLALNDSLLIFNRIAKNNFSLAVYNLNKHTFQSHLNDQYAYRLQGYDAQSRKLLLYRWQTKPTRLFGTLAADSLLSANALPDTSCLKSKYGLWQTIEPQPVNLMHLPDTLLSISPSKPVRLGQFPLQNMLSFVLPSYDKKQGWGIYGSTLWLEALQRQFLQATFILFPHDYARSALLFSHLITFFNIRFSSAYYHGPAIFSFKNGRHLDVQENALDFGMQRPWYWQGNARRMFLPSLSYIYFGYRFIKKKADFLRQSDYHGMRARMDFRYYLPTRYYPAIPKSLSAWSISYFHSFASAYPFNIGSADLKWGHNIYWEELGFKAEASWKQAWGTMPQLKRLGIDRFYQLDIPRDILETKTVRGVNEDISGDRLLWASVNMSYYLMQHSGWKLFFLPINNLALSVYYDWARIRQGSELQVWSYGAELGFGESFFRLSAGYALAKSLAAKPNPQIYGRVQLMIPETAYGLQGDVQ